MKYLLTIIITLWGIASGISQHKSYAQKQIEGLKEALIKYEQMSASDWMYFSCDSCIRKGDKSNIVLLLKTDLVLTGDLLPQEKTFNNHFDEKTFEALIKFQKRNGLIPDGILGTHTIEALNVPFASRIKQIKQGINHWKNFDTTMLEPYILVNLPDYTLQIIDSGRVIKSMKVVIGRQTSKTPVFKNELKYVVLNPSWKVPNSIATKEILPMLQNDPSYLFKNHMEVYTYNNSAEIKVNRDSIDWKKLSPIDFKYHFEQIPGPWNALGQLKFIFPNEYSIYVHDTPEKYLFSHPIRTYSHGCIRAEKPMELAAWLLRMNKKVVQELISKSEVNTLVYLPEPIPVAIDYFTIWIGEDNSLQFRVDMYHYEAEVSFN